MREINISVDRLINSLLYLSQTKQICLLDSCGASHLGSHLLIAGICPTEILELNGDFNEILERFENETNKNFAAIFTVAYNLGLKINKLDFRENDRSKFPEPDIFAAFFDCLVVYDYDLKQTFLLGNSDKFEETESLIFSAEDLNFEISDLKTSVCSNFEKTGYLEKVEQIKEFIRDGKTYQTNLTQQLTAELSNELNPQSIYFKLRKNHPAPFSAFIKRMQDFVISASPERFFQATISQNDLLSSTISTSPIKGTRPRGKNPVEDEEIKNELLTSEKDRAENIMIVDLLRNDLGRVCRFGSVKVEKLCELEEHPSLFHLVSTVSGDLRENVEISDILKAVFPCGSITGAPKIRTMQIIEQIETVPRGLSMGAIGFSIQNSDENFKHFPVNSKYFDLSVAIRTMVLRENTAYFNVGGGIVIDSVAADEYEETLTKAKALLSAINGDLK